jgi:hypothetical protein
MSDLILQEKISRLEQEIREHQRVNASLQAEITALKKRLVNANDLVDLAIAFDSGYPDTKIILRNGGWFIQKTSPRLQYLDKLGVWEDPRPEGTPGTEEHSRYLFWFNNTCFSSSVEAFQFFRDFLNRFSDSQTIERTVHEPTN